MHLQFLSFSLTTRLLLILSNSVGSLGQDSSSSWDAFLFLLLLVFPFPLLLVLLYWSSLKVRLPIFLPFQTKPIASSSLILSFVISVCSPFWLWCLTAEEWFFDDPSSFFRFLYPPREGAKSKPIDFSFSILSSVILAYRTAP